MQFHIIWDDHKVGVQHFGNNREDNTQTHKKLENHST